ncbi:GNAT family N-acetyltransferase [Brevibacillus thermoruber]|jgi:ribosomal protein S18 acetylase RimI-like enzyme|uniref:GNAT family N-acetyltransferase n=1 Tax=Brevibacillus thermoruber TaxID=33942 RepID=A0A9X3TT84_9BACL|nr:GNAT family N-acetyltransferase [Brevibacillus thermoruber]MDA5109959.1 GNAT family N-acetyltransferase [Brevibacillus thermoruber]
MIRKATPADAACVAPLIYEAIGSIAHTLTGAVEADEAIRVIEAFFRMERNRLSYENAVVAEVGGEPVGLALFYHGSRTEELDRPFVQRLARLTGIAPVIVKEARSDEFYLDTLAVRADQRGKGIGRRLLARFEAEARARGHERIALLVDQENPQARKLYESIGYRPDGTLLVSGHLYDHMVKQISVLI